MKDVKGSRLSVGKRVCIQEDIPTVDGMLYKNEGYRQCSDIQLLDQLLQDQFFVTTPGFLQQSNYLDRSHVLQQ